MRFAVGWRGSLAYFLSLDVIGVSEWHQLVFRSYDPGATGRRHHRLTGSQSAVVGRLLASLKGLFLGSRSPSGTTWCLETGYFEEGHHGRA